MIRGLLLTLTMMVFSLSCTAADEPAPSQYVAGVHYDLITPNTWTADPESIELAEFFWYGCGHCYTFEPIVAQWKKTMPEDVSFRGVPAVWRDVMALHAKAYYTAELLGVGDKIHPAIFRAMNVERNPLPSQSALEKLFVDNGVSAEDFNKTFNSFGIDSQVRKAQAQGVAAGLTGTPALMVAGKYYISGRKLGGQAEMLKVADFLIEKERAARSK